MKKTIYLTVLSVITIACILIGSYRFCSNFSFRSFGWNWNDRPSRSVHTESQTLSSFHTIRADLDVAEITIEEGTDYSLYYEATKELIPQYELKDDVLTLRHQNQSLRDQLKHGNNECTIIITVPIGTALTLLDLCSDVGNISLENVQCQKAIIESDVGEIKVEEGTIMALDLSSSIGDIDVENTTFQTLDASSDVGEVKIRPNDPVSKYSLELKTDVGEISVLNNDYMQHYNSAGTDGYSITASSSVGDVTVE